MVRWNHTPVSEELGVAVKEAVRQKSRAFTIDSDTKRPRCIIDKTVPASPSIGKDFEAINQLFVVGKPCLVMVRLLDEVGSFPGVTEADWGMLCYIPEDAPTGKKLKIEGLNNSLKEHFEDTTKELHLKALHFSKKFENLSEAIFERAAPRSGSIAARFQNEESTHLRQLEKKLTDVEEQAEKIKFNIGFISLEVTPKESFKLALGLLLQEAKGTMCIDLEGDNNELLHGEVLDDIVKVSQLGGRVPADKPRYYARMMEKEDDKQLLLITWLPDAASPQSNILYSTTKASVLSVLVAATKGANCELCQAEVHHQAEFDGELPITDVEIGQVIVRRASVSGMAARESQGTLGKKKRHPKYRRSTYQANKDPAAFAAKLEAANAKAKAEAEAEDAEASAAAAAELVRVLIQALAGS